MTHSYLTVYDRASGKQIRSIDVTGASRTEIDAATDALILEMNQDTQRILECHFNPKAVQQWASYQPEKESP